MGQKFKMTFALNERRLTYQIDAKKRLIPKYPGFVLPLNY
jgi:hypothetical protein